VTGSSRSTNYPVLNPYAATNSGLLDIVVTKLDGNDGQILYSTYFGGEFDDEGWGIDVDPEGQAHVTGITGSGFFFPVVNAFQPVSGGLRDAFVLKLSASGSHVIYSSFLGGYNEDGGYGIAVGPNNSAYVTGYTYSATQYPLPGTDWSQSGTNLFDNAFLAQILPINPSLRGRLDEQDALVLAWPAELSSFKVVSTGTLGRTNTTWTNVTATPVIVGPPADPDSLSVVVITNPPPNQFYKLAPPW
jgi:hypothetical protein